MFYIEYEPGPGIRSAFHNSRFELLLNGAECMNFLCDLLGFFSKYEPGPGVRRPSRFYFYYVL